MMDASSLIFIGLIACVLFGVGAGLLIIADVLFDKIRDRVTGKKTFIRRL